MMSNDAIVGRVVMGKNMQAAGASIYQEIAALPVSEQMFKRIYFHVITFPEDKQFLQNMAKELTEVDKKGAIDGYNNWLANYKAEEDVRMKNVGEWYSGVCEKRRVENDRDKKHGRNEVSKNNWTKGKSRLQKRKEDLLRQEESLKELIASLS